MSGWNRVTLSPMRERWFLARWGIYTPPELAARLQVSPNTVRTLARRYGLPLVTKPGRRPGSGRFTQAQLDDLVTLWRRNCSLREIADTLHAAPATVHRRAVALGLKRRRGPRGVMLPKIEAPQPTGPQPTRWRCPHCGRLNALETHERSGTAVRVGCAHESPSEALQRERAARLAVCRQLRIQMQEGR